MSDAPPSGGSSGLGFFVAFFAIIIFLALSLDGGDGIFSELGKPTASSTEERIIEAEYSTDTSSPSYSSGNNTSSANYTPPPPPPPTLTPAQVEDRIAQIYRQLDSLRKEVREAVLREPVSPYTGKIELQSGNVYDTDPEREHLMLRANYQNTIAIPISGWYVESYVTNKRSAIPKGDRLMTSWRSPSSEPILLGAQESVYLITGESPIDTSFRENLCTGYLKDEGDFQPALYSQCPYPKDEMDRSGVIKLDNDECHEFVQRIPSCTNPSEEQIDAADINGICTRFIENTFNYNDCVSLHRYDPYFERNGYWRVYLDERSELWRKEREIIRLMDENDRVVDVLEY